MQGEVGLSEQLQAADTPEHVAEYLERLAPKMWRWWLTQAAFFVLMLGGFAVGGYFIWPVLEQMTAHNAMMAAMDANAVMVGYNFGVSMVLALFGWIFAAGALSGLLSVMSEQARASAFTYNMLAARGVAQWSVRRTLRELEGDSDPERFVRRAVWSWQSWAVGLGAALMTVSAYAATRDVQAHDIFTRSHFIASPLLPWGSRAPVAWSEAELVEVGCNHATGRNAYDSIIYRVHLPGRYFVSLESGQALGDWLVAAEAIDAELRDGGVPFQRWDWMGRDPLHPQCLAVMRQSWEEDYPRIERLLRIGELPDR